MNNSDVVVNKLMKLLGEEGIGTGPVRKDPKWEIPSHDFVKWIFGDQETIRKISLLEEQAKKGLKNAKLEEEVKYRSSYNPTSCEYNQNYELLLFSILTEMGYTYCTQEEESNRKFEPTSTSFTSPFFTNDRNHEYFSPGGSINRSSSSPFTHNIQSSYQKSPPTREIRENSKQIPNNISHISKSDESSAIIYTFGNPDFKNESNYTENVSNRSNMTESSFRQHNSGTMQPQYSQNHHQQKSSTQYLRNTRNFRKQ